MIAHTTPAMRSTYNALNVHLESVLRSFAERHSATLDHEAYFTELGHCGNHFVIFYYPEGGTEGRIVILDVVANVKENGTVNFGFMPPLFYASSSLQDQAKGHVAHDLNELSQQQAAIVVAIHEAILSNAQCFFESQGVHSVVHRWDPSSVNTDRAVACVPEAST